MGLEPTTFCMANASGRSRPFAPVRSSRVFPGSGYTRANGSEPERTLNLAILAMEPGTEVVVNEMGLGEILVRDG
jgi:hypothetical protein